MRELARRVRRFGDHIALSFIVFATLGVGLLGGPTPTLLSTALAEPTMLTSPEDPGPDVPPVGRSLFDFLFATTDSEGTPTYEIPHPFEALTAHLSDYLITTSTRPLQQVLIPLGRSLQREAAAPNYFHFPRAVVAAEAEPQLVADKPLIRLKDRLYLGYQEKTGVLEVISYNEAAARFEFQIVHNYRAGATPDVRYAERGTCAGCHQNLAPIFADEPWSESNSNPAVAAGLRTVAESFYGIPAFVGMDIPGLINVSAQRANLFSAHQAFWKEGCGRDTTQETAGCRADAAYSALVYRLAGNVHDEAIGDVPKRRVAGDVVRSWQAQWPEGLGIHGPLVADREPGNGSISRAQLYSRQEQTPLAELPAAQLAAFEEFQEPLYLRPPKEVWKAPRSFGRPPSANAPWMKRWIDGLSDYFAPQDITAIDDALAKAGTELPVTTIKVSCAHKTERMVTGEDRQTFTCNSATENDSKLSIKLRLDKQDGQVVDSFGEGLRVGYNQSTPPMTVNVLSAPGEEGVRVWLLEPRLKIHRGISTYIDTLNSGRRLRLPDGRLVRRFEITIDNPDTASLSVDIVNDITILEAAIAQMRQDTLDGAGDSFSGKPFRRVGVLKPLFAELDIAADGWCCETVKNFPPVRLEYE